MDVQKTISRACVELLKKNPFYGHIITQFPKILTNRIPTLAVGKSDSEGLLVNLYINPEYVEKLYHDFPKEKAFYHLVEVVKHETLHVVFSHLMLKKPNKQALNIACELSVNSYVDKQALVQKGIYASDFGFKERLGVEEYYKLLDTEKQKESDEKETTDGNGEDKTPGEMLDSHSTWEAINSDDVKTEVFLKDVIMKAKEATIKTGGWGSLPGEIIDAIDTLLEIQEEKIPWQVVLKDFIASASDSVLDYTNKRISKRFGTRPGTKKEDSLKLAIGIDTSGSIDNKTLEMFFAELQWIAKSNSEITVFECDCTIGREYPFRAFDGSGITGRGGTDLEPVIKEASDRRFDALIYFTDGEAPAISIDYNIPVLFVISGWTYHRDRSTLSYPAQVVFHVLENGEVEIW